MLKQFIFNGKYYDDGTAIISSACRGLRFGDGCFETMKMIRGNLALKDLHFERLFSSIDKLRLRCQPHFTRALLERQISALAEKNKHFSIARIRITVFGGNGGLYDAESDFANFLIETFPLDITFESLNENGLILGLFEDARKTCDCFSHIKSNSFLPYVQAARWAKDQKLNDAIVLNSFGRIADTTIANLFLVINGTIKTPAIKEGCIAGVMRKHLLQSCYNENIPIEECELNTEDLHNASECFITNSIRGIRWVRQIGQANFRCDTAKVIHSKFIQPLWH